MNTLQWVNMVTMPANVVYFSCPIGLDVETVDGTSVLGTSVLGKLD